MPLKFKCSAVAAALVAAGVFAGTGPRPQVSNGQVVAGHARFTAITPECIRIEYGSNFVDDPSYFAVNRKARANDVKIQADGGHVVVNTGAIRLDYQNDGKPFSETNLHAVIGGQGRAVEWRLGLTNAGNLGGTERTLDTWDGAKQKLSDGLLSRGGWFLLDDSKSPLFGNDWVKGRPKGAGTDWYLFGYGSDYKGALKSLTAIAGPVPMPRRYVFGAWYSRYWSYTSQDFRQIVREYREHDFPLDVMVMDMNWHLTDVPGVPRAHANLVWTGYTWDRKLLPDAEELLKWFHQEGLAVTLNDHPADGVWPHEERYAAFMRKLGRDPAAREHVAFDSGDRKYLDAFYSATHVPLEREGVDFWWVDWQQYPNARSVPEISNLAALNEYYFHQSSTHDRRGLDFSRWAGWGDQRHPIHFSGDASTSFKMLAFEVPFTSTAGNVGCFFWSHDIGGHNRGRNEESYARWCQFGAFSAALRSHSTRDPQMDRRPWTYPQWAEDSMRVSFHLRSRFFPYTYSSIHESSVESIPLLRPMYLEYPAVEEAYRQPQQYLYGDNLLVAPVAEAGAGPRRLGRQVVWFPEGTWFNFFSGERFEGGKERLVAATIDEVPLYIRGGVPVPMQPYTQRMTSTPLTNVVVRCYPGEEDRTNTYALYEDDGLSQDYTHGKFAQTAMTYSRHGNRVAVKITPAKGSFDGQLRERSYSIELPCTQKATQVQVDRKAAVAEYVEPENLNRVTISPRSIRSGCEIVVDVADADQASIRAQAYARRSGLPSIAPRTSWADLVSSAADKAGDEREKVAVLAAAGQGTFSKIESPTGYPATGMEKTYGSER
jgi:alpha-glucosidase (family GH31 glycosyl hydrolase)